MRINMNASPIQYRKVLSIVVLNRMVHTFLSNTLFLLLINCLSKARFTILCCMALPSRHAASHCAEIDSILATQQRGRAQAMGHNIIVNLAYT